MFIYFTVSVMAINNQISSNEYTTKAIEYVFKSECINLQKTSDKCLTK